MTEEQQNLIKALARCRFGAGSWDQRFVHDLREKPPTYELTPKQSEQLERVAWTYRRQLPFPVAKPAWLAAQEAKARSWEQNEERKKLAAWNEGKPL